MAPTHSNIELEARTSVSDQTLSDSWQQDPALDAHLPPTDRGKDAYLFLTTCVMLEALVWGFPIIFGVFQDYYSTHAPFAGSSNIAVVGTCALGLMYMGLPVAYWILKVFPRIRKWSTICGLVVMCLSLAAASFATTVTHLILTQGIFFALGGVFAWTPVLFWIDQWFVLRLRFAFGVMLSGLGLAGAALPPVVQWLLASHGYQTTLRVCALIIFVMTAPFLFFFKPRLPITSLAAAPARPDLSFWKTPLFAISQFGNMIEALGYFLPGIYLPTYAKSIGAGPFLATLTIMLVNAGSFVGNLAMGAIVERYHFSTGVLVSTVGTVVAVFCFWGLAASLPMLYVFCVLYGLFATSYPSTWPGIMRDVQKKKENADSGMIFASLAAGKGVGNIVSGPLSEALLKGTSWRSAASGFGSGYGMLIVFTGVTAFVGGCSFAARRAGWL